MKKIILMILCAFLLFGCGKKEQEESIDEVVETNDTITEKKLKLPFNSYDVGDPFEMKKAFEKAGFQVELEEEQMNKSECSWNDNDIFGIYAINKNNSDDLISVFNKDDELSDNYIIKIVYIHVIDDSDTAKDDTQEVEEEFVNTYTKLTSFKLNTQTEYSHCNTESVILGNGEGVLFRFTLKPKSATEDDILIGYDESLFKCELNNTYSDDESITYVYRITAKKPCSDSIVALSTYDYVENYEDANGYEVYVHALDSRDGKVVYVTDNGEKYHYSEKCAGEYAIKTTLYDAEMLEYDKCGKCCN